MSVLLQYKYNTQIPIEKLSFPLTLHNIVRNAFQRWQSIEFTLRIKERAAGYSGIDIKKINEEKT